MSNKVTLSLPFLMERNCMECSRVFHAQLQICAKNNSDGYNLIVQSGCGNCWETARGKITSALMVEVLEELTEEEFDSAMQVLKDQ